MNALIAALIARNASFVEIIYALDPERKDICEYLRVTRAILSDIRVTSEHVIEFDSQLFWAGRKNELLSAARQALKPIVEQNPDETVYFGNCLTNPIALALKRFAKVNHLYHAPGDFVSMLFPEKKRWRMAFKNMLKKSLGIELYKIEIDRFPIYSLLNFRTRKHFEHIDFRYFFSTEVERITSELRAAMGPCRCNIMLLLAGDEPEPGDENQSNIVNYLQPHLQAVETIIADDKISSATLWIKEHKSYLPLTKAEREVLSREFSELGCSVRFVADYLPKEYRALPGECILRFCRVDYLIGEPSGFLFNVAGSDVTPVAAVQAFQSCRDKDQLGRNREFIAINDQLVVQCRVY